MYDCCANFYNLHICGSICCMLSVIIVRSSTYVVVVYVEEHVLKWYSMLSFSNHLKSCSKNLMNRYKLRVSSCMVSRLISTVDVVPKLFPMKDVVEFLYIFSNILTASRGNPRSSMKANSLI